jgi:hypothetical protein
MKGALVRRTRPSLSSAAIAIGVELKNRVNLTDFRPTQIVDPVSAGLPSGSARSCRVDST